MNWPWRNARRNLQRNFQGYSTRGGADIYAFGMSAISQIPDGYWQNKKELPKWQAAVDTGKTPMQRAYFLTDEDKIRRETIMRVMCDLSLDFAAMSQKLGIHFQEHFAGELAALAPFEADGLVKPQRRLASKSPMLDDCSSATSQCALTIHWRLRASGDIPRRFNWSFAAEMLFCVIVKERGF